MIEQAFGRERALEAMVLFDRPVRELQAIVAKLPWDADQPLVTLTRAHLKAVLRRYTAGEIDAPSVEDWANLIEGREDIDFERGRETVVADTVFDLANPLLQGPLAEIASGILARLED